MSLMNSVSVRSNYVVEAVRTHEGIPVFPRGILKNTSVFFFYIHNNRTFSFTVV